MWMDPSTALTRVGSNNSTLPTEFKLLGNYPNPFKNSTTVSYALPVQGKVTIHVYNSLGQLVKSLVDANQNAGDYSIRMDGCYVVVGAHEIRDDRVNRKNICSQRC